MQAFNKRILLTREEKLLAFCNRTARSLWDAKNIKMDFSMNGTDSNETWIQNSRPLVSAVSVGMILLAVATFLLQLCLVLTMMYRCWRKDQKIWWMNKTDLSKVPATVNTKHVAGQQRDCSGSAVKVPLYPSTPYVMPCYSEEPAAFPPWDLVQSV
ncbi:hypothetical protein GN956_G3132 [Arapaima gigas]